MYETMTITFQINYQTVWGQQLLVCGNLPELGQDDPNRAPLMTHIGGGFWRLSIPFKKLPAQLSYRYYVSHENGLPSLVEASSRQIRLSRNVGENCFLLDSWRDAEHPDNPFYTAAFEEVVFKPNQKFKSNGSAGKSDAFSVSFNLRDVQSPQQWQLAVLGSIPELGGWDYARPLLLGNAEFPIWQGEISLAAKKGFEYKYGWYDPTLKRVVELEAGPNRKCDGAPIGPNSSAIILNDENYTRPRGPWKGAGVAIPVFALRSEKSLGVGEFTDLKKMVDWAKQTGLSMVQVLPVNDTVASHTWVDSYPYAAISVFALHPLFLNVEALAGVDTKKINSERKKLNALDKVDYEAVMKLKMSLARTAFDRDEKFLEDPKFQAFLAENKHWLEPYALFCYLRDAQKTVEFAKWGENAVYSEALLKKMLAPKSKAYRDICFHLYLQYHLDTQLREAADYARSQGIVLKGDLPIGIYRHSADAWVAPQLYNMNGQAGAPPDPFSDTGQNWGFPTYNWEEMAKDGYAWWRQRMTHLSRYFTAYRIDHILGFFRIWQIPLEAVEGTLGFFNPAIPIARQELISRGIRYDHARFCQPYVTEQDLVEHFGENAAWVKAEMLTQVGEQNYAFQPAFDTQRKIEAYFQDPKNATKVHLRQGLYTLIGNVLLLEVPGSNGEAFHPRIEMSKTRSYQRLPYDQQQKLQELYLDYFYRRQEDFWREQAMQKLPALKAATKMLICGEDLGMVPACVPGVMREMGILTLEIQRMSKNPATEFLQEQDIPYHSVASPSTHDMAPTRAWWEESERAQMQRFYYNELHFAGEVPYFCEPFVAKAIVEQHLRWPSMWTVFPLQDLLAMDGKLRHQDPFEERINVPAIIPYYWRYRMHLNLEELQRATDFNLLLKQLLFSSGR
jgi:4-alpha-glucanotransferase